MACCASREEEARRALTAWLIHRNDAPARVVREERLDLEVEECDRGQRSRHSHLGAEPVRDSLQSANMLIQV